MMGTSRTTASGLKRGSVGDGPRVGATGNGGLRHGSCAEDTPRLPAGTMEPMRRVALSSAVLAALLVALVGGPARAADPTAVVVLRVEGPIDRSTLAYLDDRLAQAERDGAVVVLQLDTSGTLGEDGARARPAGRRPRRAGARLGRPHAGDRVGARACC